MLTEAEKAGAILNTRRAIPLSDGLEVQMRRLKMRELLEHTDHLGAKVSVVLSGMDPGTKMIAALPALLRAIGEPAFGILAQVTDMEAGEVADLDVEDFADMLLVFTEMHEKAIATFQRAFEKFDEKKRDRQVKGSNGASMPSSGRDIASPRSEISPLTGS